MKDNRYIINEIFENELEVEMIRNTVIAHRKHLNSCAELGLSEFKTSKYIREQLDRLNVEYKPVFNTGTVGIIKGKNPKRTVAFRADIDALKTEEGPKHLCGHDGHASILLGFIELIVKNKHRLNDNIVFIFQPAEEGPGGAEEIIKAGVFEEYKIDEIYGLHLFPGIAQGRIGVKPGYLFAQIADFNIDIKAKSCHGAAPHEGIDGILIAANLINSVQSIVSRNITPLESVVVSIGKIFGGDRRNIVAENVRLEGTIRCYSQNVYEVSKARLTEICKGLEIVYNCEIKVEILDDYIAVDNDENMALEARKAFGENAINIEPQLMSEDFSYYQKQVPGVFFLLGSRNEEEGFVNALHNFNFNFNEKVLLHGIDFYTTLAKYKNMID